METKVIILYFFAIVFSVLRPIIFKEYNKYIYGSLFLSSITTLLGSLSIFTYKYHTGKINKEKLITKLKEGVTPKNMMISIISQIRFMLKFIAISVLPLSISIPISKMDIIFTEIFDYYINGSPITINLFISLILLLIGLFLINYNKIMNKKHKGNYSNIYIVLLLLSTVSVGFLNVYYTNYDKDHEADDVMYIETLAASVFTFFVYVFVVVSKKEVILPFNTMLKIFTLCLLVFNSSIAIKWYLLKDTPLLENQLIMNLSIVISFMVGVIYYKEHISMTKVVGLCIVMFAVIYYSYNLDIQDEPKDTIKDKYVPSNVH